MEKDITVDGQRLEADIANLRLSIPDFAEKAGVSKSKMYDIVKGKPSNLRLDTILLVAQGLGITIQTFISKYVGTSVTTFDPYVIPFISYLQVYREQIRYIPRTLSPVDDSELFQEDPEWNVEGIVESGSNFLITGEPGMGKTTLLDEVCLISAIRERIPLYADLRYVSGQLKGFKDQIKAQALRFRSNRDGIGIDLTDADLESNAFTFLFDHLDHARSDTVDSINEFVAERSGKGDQFIVACRTNLDSLYSRLRDFSVVEIDELDDETIESRFSLAGIYGASENDCGLDETTEDVVRIADIRGASGNYWLLDLYEFVNTPYRLMMVTDILRGRIETGKKLILPSETELYREFVENHIEKERRERGTGTPIGLRMRVLAHLAFEMQRLNNQGLFRRIWAEDFLSRIVPPLAEEYGITSAERVIEDLQVEGFVHLSPDRNYFTFSHDLLREFFCAWHFHQNMDGSQALEFISEMVRDPENRLHDKWIYPIVLYAGLIEDIAPLIDILSDATNDDIFFTHFTLAYQCFRNRIPTSDELPYEYLTTEIDETASDKYLREMWAYSLHIEEHPESFPLFMLLPERRGVYGKYAHFWVEDHYLTPREGDERENLFLSDEEVKKRVADIRELQEEKESPFSMEPLLQMAVDDREDLRVRREAISSLSKMETLSENTREGIVQTLVSLLSDKDFHIRIAAAGSLEWIWPEKAFGILCRRFHRERDEVVKSSIMYSLARISYESGVKLTEWLMDRFV